MMQSIAAVIEEARVWTRRLVELPDGEDAVNADLPMAAVQLLVLALHETYPGHHTERHLPGRTGALPLVRGGRAGALSAGC